MSLKIREVEPLELKKWVDDGLALLIDVRERLEYHEEHIPKAQLYPASKFDPRELPEPSDKQIVFYCASGKRSAAAGAKWALHLGAKEAYNLAGGLAEWKRAGLPTVVNLEAERKVEHQAYIWSGSLVIVGSLLTVFFSNWFLLLPLLAGSLLLASGFAGHCYFSYILSKLPYNR